MPHALDAAGLRWLLLRPDTMHPTRPEQVGDRQVGDGQVEDTDLLVEWDRARVRRALAAVGYRRLRTPGHGAHAFFTRFDPAGGWTRLDLVDRVDFGAHGEYRTGLAASMLARRQPLDGLWHPAASDGFWHLLSHCLLDKDTSHGIAGHRWAQLRHLANRAGILALATPPADIPYLIREAVALEGVRADDQARAISSVRAGGKLDPLEAATLRRATRLARRLPPGLAGRGVTVALIGPDGAGKSTLATNLARTSVIPARVLYAGLPKRAEVPGTDKGPGLPGSWLVRRAAQLTRISVLSRTQRALGRVVILDRHPLDRPAAVGREPLKQQLIRWVETRLAPSPDLVVVLDVPGHVAHRRSGEHTPHHLDAMRTQYRQAAARRPGWHLIDGTLAPHDTVRAVTHIIWSRLHANR